jgi:hypothetical protein
MANPTPPETPPACANCGRLWLDESERWKAHLNIYGEAPLFCPECDEQEFGDS